MTNLEMWQGIASLALTGAVVSTFVQVIKKWIDKSIYKHVWVIGLSIVGGAIIFGTQFLSPAFWATALGVWAAANSVYVAFWKNLQA